MEFKGTKGSWSIKKHPNYNAMKVGNEFNPTVCDVYDEANAKLIAAAPEMLDRLLATNSHLKSILDTQNLTKSAKMLIGFMIIHNEEAINKALK